MKFLAQIIGKWQKALIGSGFKTAPTNWFDNNAQTKEGAKLPISEKVREEENQFAWIVEYE